MIKRRKINEKITILVIEKKVELFQLLIEFNVQGPREAFFHELASEKRFPSDPVH